MVLIPLMMKGIYVFSVLALLITFLMVFYSTLNLETAKSYTSEVKLFSKVEDQNLDILLSEPQSFTLPEPDVDNVSVSESFRQTIPQNGAYWNRLLYSRLKNLGKRESPLRDKLSWSKCRQANEESLKINVHNFNSYPAPFQDFLRVMDCRSSAALALLPHKCLPIESDGENQTLLLFAIKSNPGNFERRQAVRETWGQEMLYPNGLQIRRVFILGNPYPEDPNLGPLLSFEKEYFGDILQWDFQESFLNLTLKMNLFLPWTLKHCPHASFVFSGDDDVFVNTPALVTYLQSLEPSKASRVYVGHVINSAGPIRDQKSKYYIPTSFYNGPYPPYAGGGGFLISGALLKPLYSVSFVIPFFPIDDVYIGMCAKALGVSPQGHAGFQTFDVKEEDRDNLCIHKNLILIHQRLPKQLMYLWKGIHSPLLSC